MIVVREDLAEYIKERGSVEFPVNMEDPIIHTESHPLCFDKMCPCRDDVDNMNLLGELIRAGVISPEEADVIMQGATI
jgi:hypothetical protein